ncbi:MAG TPA: UvrD-helicase domain-containing protein [Candidatus Paceibacterota bacterium]|nr:UvrD-helicase domain-containing protein [Candidatus Paceibacterota bacterium]
MQSLLGLNERQKEAVLHTSGPLLILAGAGAGKTKTVTHRILRLIEEGVNPSNILAITFTNKAAKEMRERVEKLLSESRDINLPVSIYERPFVSTFHALGVHIIRENHRVLGLPRHFSIFDRSDSLSAVKAALVSAGLDPKQWEPSKILSGISRLKGQGKTLADFQERETRDARSDILSSVWAGYEKALQAEKALDFDDLLLKTFSLLRAHKEILAHYRKTWTHVHIDEYQDTNRVQYDIAKLLAGESRNICAVGDIDQSIYSWRGADFKNIMRFEDDYPEAKVVLLEENYRSTKTILKAANAVIAKNTLRKDKNLFTENAEGEKIALYGAYDEEAEAHFVAKTSASLIASGSEPEEIAVLYRANFQSRALEEAFLKQSVPYQVLGVRFFERKEVKDLLSYLRASLNPEALGDLKRILNTPARGIGKTTALKIFEGKEAELPPAMRLKIANFRLALKEIAEKIGSTSASEAVAFALSRSGLKEAYETKSAEDEERLENMYELVALAEKYDALPAPEGIEKLLTEAALASDQDDLEKKQAGVKLMTVHASKGLEFDYVFITGLEEDLFPHKRGFEEKIEEKEEERRLFYVALTRARKKLFLTYASVRTVFGSRGINMPSHFLEDIAENLLEAEEEDRPHGKVIYLE